MTISIRNGEKLTEQGFVNLIQKFRSRSGLEIVRIRSGKEIVLKPIVRMNVFSMN
jgi:hypothetical protein